jgi:hypothetical protein
VLEMVQAGFCLHLNFFRISFWILNWKFKVLSWCHGFYSQIDF